MLEYPKIETLFDRKEDFSLDTSKPRKAEFTNVRNWAITEKVDGTNVRIGLMPDGSMEFGGRTETSQMPVPLVKVIQSLVTPEKLQAAFEKDAETGLWPAVVIFAEGYGNGINKGGKYRSDLSIRVFDVNVGGFWLEQYNVEDVARKLGLAMVPSLFMYDTLVYSESGMRSMFLNNKSIVASADSSQNSEPEGIVAKAFPMLYDKFGERMIWKLKFSDFRKGKK